MFDFFVVFVVVFVFEIEVYFGLVMEGWIFVRLD